MMHLDKAKLIWRCRRGMLELDLMLSSFVDHHFDCLNEQQSMMFERLLSQADPDIYAWLMGYETPDDEELREIVSVVRAHDRT